MLKILFLLFLFISNSIALDFTIIEITTDSAFNHFASLMFWLLLISSPMFLVLSLVKHVQRSLKK